MNEPWTKKLDAHGWELLETGLPESGVDVTVRLNQVAKELVELVCGAGFHLQYQVHDILVGHVDDPAGLERIAKLPTVAEMQVSRPLYGEDPSAGG